MTSDLLIVGAGVGGLTLAVKLAQQHVSFTIYDREENGLETGAGLLLAPNATRILQKLDILTEALQLGHVTSRWLILNQSGAILREVQVGSHELPAISIHRADLRALLQSHLPDGCIRNRAAVGTVRDFGESVELSLEDGSVVPGRALIGADGIRSVIRRHLFGEQRRLRYRGYIGWRGIAPFIPKGYEHEMLSETWGAGRRFGIAAVGKGRTYWYASANQTETWNDAAPKRQANLLRRFGNWHAPVAELIAATPNDEILVSRIYDAPKLPAWSQGNITLLGDAAHAMTPNLGQGACLAMEDAWALGFILPDDPEPAAAFRKYENVRMKRAYFIQRQSQAMGWVVQAEHPLTLGARNWLTPRVPEGLIHLAMRSLFAEHIR